MTSPIKYEATKWSELPEVLAKYEQEVRAGDGISRLFGYASLIKVHTNEKPESSSKIPNEKARLPGMEVDMNVLAAGEYEFRGTRGTYIDKNGQEKPFANIGIYAGLQPAANKDGYAEGINITASTEDMKASLTAYINRELGNPPTGITVEDLFDKTAKSKFDALKGKDEDKFGMYKFQVADVNLAGDTNKKVPAITVSTNEESKFAVTNLSPMQKAQLILDGHGYDRELGIRYYGGTALDYFKENCTEVARDNGFSNPRIDAIDKAVDQLAGIYTQVHNTITKHLPEAEEAKVMDTLIRETFNGMSDVEIIKNKLSGINSPYFNQGEDVNTRAPVSDADKILPQNQMAHTAEEKFSRVADLKAKGKTSRTI